MPGTTLQTASKPIEIQLSKHVSETHITDRHIKLPVHMSEDIRKVVGDSGTMIDTADNIRNDIMEGKASRGLRGPVSVILDCEGIQSTTPYFTSRLVGVGKATRSTFIIINASKSVAETFKNMDTEAFKFADSIVDAYEMAAARENCR